MVRGGAGWPWTRHAGELGLGRRPAARTSCAVAAVAGALARALVCHGLSRSAVGPGPACARHIPRAAAHADRPAGPVNGLLELALAGHLVRRVASGAGRPG